MDGLKRVGYGGLVHEEGGGQDMLLSDILSRIAVVAGFKGSSMLLTADYQKSWPSTEPKNIQKHHYTKFVGA